ncbi:MAG: NifU family protein [Burkholderiales bacterium]|nr:NifU family protein [Burkholderiales bacterium]
MPKIADIELTPNPNARKFVLREPLTYGVARSYESAESAQGDPLAAALFAIPHVVSVFYVDTWLTVTQDGEADWNELARQVAVPIREAPGAAERTSDLLAGAMPDVQVTPREELSADTLQKLEMIESVLDQQVRPYLRNDGGDLHVLGIEGNVVKVHYQGACGSCPSSLSGTLSAIEYMVREIDPELEVMPV